MFNFVWFSSRIKTHSKFLSQFDFLDQNVFNKSEILNPKNFVKINIDNLDIINQKQKSKYLNFCLNSEWNCNQKFKLENLQKLFQNTLRRKNYDNFLDNCLNYLTTDIHFGLAINSNYFLFNLNLHKNWVNFPTHLILSHIINSINEQKKDIVLHMYIRNRNLNNLSFLKFIWFPKNV